MTHTQELRAIAVAAWQAWKDAQGVATLTSGELLKLKRTAAAAHDAWLNAATETLTGGRHVTPGE